MKHKLVILASGNGSNAQHIAEYFQEKGSASVSLIMSNKRDAYVLERARKLNIPSIAFTWHDLYNSDIVLSRLIAENPSLIVLAGFLWLIPEIIIRQFNGQIINIHPALLPKFGGKGMYGAFVHEAVLAANEKESGITIHLVNEKYDKGDIIFQARCAVLPDDTPDSLAHRIHELEYRHYPEVMEKLLKNKTNPAL
ncbi:MAG: phosphoribosylglycinamide formyltransferase [Bacteroidales bacterium]|nr:phosphoribosylglycinamide formyltransferase [Bacteroidales bacterium]MDZ4205157.1 phosphoribosylglycinamide formyltransferase [Bacteroidales bacterium]